MNTFHIDTGGVLRLAGRVLRDARVVSGVRRRPKIDKSEERREVVEVRRNLDELLAFIVDFERQRARGGGGVRYRGRDRSGRKGHSKRFIQPPPYLLLQLVLLID